MKVFERVSKIILISVFLFLSLSRLASASFEITEIMYDLDGTDTGREWVEVYNNGSESADFSHWYFFSDNTKHSVAAQGSSSIPPSGYAVIAQDVSKFKIDWPNYTGLIFDSSWTGLSNDGETIGLKDPDLNLVSSVSFTSSMGAGGDGNSLQNISGSWVGALPTPGAQNQSSGSGGGGGSGGGSSGVPSVVTTDPKIVVKKETETPKIVTSILSKNIAFAGIPLKIDFRTTGLKKEPIIIGRFAWNFGDGTGFSISDQKEFEHTYQYPGEYVLILSYFSNIFQKSPEATDRMIIKVLPSEVLISSVGSTTDPYVELSNKSNYEVDLSNWNLKNYTHSFSIPGGTIILPNNKIKISSKITGFTVGDLSYLILENTKGEVMTTYPVYNNSVHINGSYDKTTQDNTHSKDPDVIDLNNLGASAGNANISNQYISTIGLALIILIGIMTVLLIKKNKSFDEIDNNIKASDITIME